MAKIGIFTIADISKMNMEHIVYTIAKMLSSKHHIDLIGSEKMSQRIEQELNSYSYFRRYYKSSFLRKILLLPFSFLNLFIYVLLHKPDILMAVSNIGVNGLTVVCVSKIFSIPTVVRTTSDTFNEYKYQGKGKILKKWKTFLNNNVLGRMSIKYANKVIVLNRCLLKGLIAKGYDREKFVVIPPCLNLDFDRKENKIDIRKKFFISENKKIILYIGRLDKDKGTDRLIRVVQYVLKRSTEFHFVIVGAGKQRAIMEKKLNFKEVHFPGVVPHNKLKPYFRQSDIFINTSLREGVANVFIEALYFGLPIIASDSGPATRDLVTNIAKSKEEMAGYILSGEIQQDRIPVETLPQNNRKLHLNLISSLLYG